MKTYEITASGLEINDPARVIGAVYPAFSGEPLSASRSAVRVTVPDDAVLVPAFPFTVRDVTNE